MRLGRPGRLATVAFLLVALPAAAGAQEPETPAAAEITFTPRERHSLDRRLDDFLRRGGWRLLTSDTVLGPDARLGDDLLVLEATVRLAGSVAGDVFVVDGDLFIRPGARIGGDVVVLGGGYYGSSLARIEGDLVYRPTEDYRVIPHEGGRLIFAVEEVPEAFTLHGLHGLHAPAYQRTDEWTLAWGATARVVDLPWRPSLDGIVRFRTQQGEFEGTLRQLWHPAEELHFGLLAERATRTEEEWIRETLSNTLSYLFVGNDYRNYHQADRVALLFGRSPETAWAPSVRVQWEKARSLEARPQWVVFGDDVLRPNPAIDEGEALSLIAALDLRRTTAVSALQAHVALEAADSDVAGDFSFLMGRAQIRWTGPAALDHGLELFAIARGDLAGSLPRQRHSAFGGVGTLPTFPILAFGGERMLFGRVTYAVPVWPLDLGPLGVPELFLRGAVGAAWDSGRPAHFQQNLFLGARAAVLMAAVVADPGAPDFDPELILTLKLPGDL